MRKISLILLGFLGVLAVKAQQDPQFTQNMFNRLATNPGYAGSNGSICGTILTREQWIGFEGNPRTNVLSIDGAFKVKQKHQLGAGLTVIQDEIGPINSLNVKLALSYHKRINQGVLGIGIEPGLFNQSISADWRTSEGNFDGTEDPFIPNNEAGATVFDLGLGLYYYTKELYVGISSTHLTQPTFAESLSDNSEYSFNQVRHYYVTAGYDYDLNSLFQLQPSVFIKTDAVNTQVDINANVLYNNLVWGGVTYRIEDAIAFLGGVNIPQVPGLRFGFAYDYNISDLGDYNDGSLEFMLNYCYKIQKKVRLERYKSVRFL